MSMKAIFIPGSRKMDRDEGLPRTRWSPGPHKGSGDLRSSASTVRPTSRVRPSDTPGTPSGLLVEFACRGPAYRRFRSVPVTRETRRDPVPGTVRPRLCQVVEGVVLVVGTGWDESVVCPGLHSSSTGPGLDRVPPRVARSTGPDPETPPGRERRVVSPTPRPPCAVGRPETRGESGTTGHLKGPGGRSFGPGVKLVGRPSPPETFTGSYGDVGGPGTPGGDTGRSSPPETRSVPTRGRHPVRVYVVLDVHRSTGESPLGS